MKNAAALVCVLSASLLRADDRPVDCPKHAEAAKPPSAHSASGPYAGREGRSIKALPDDEVRGYVEGRGMGLAQPAELNHYPGPRHVLDAARELALTPEQSAALEGVFRRMDASARRLGAAYVAGERELDAFFTGGGADPARLSELTRRAGVLLGELRAAHLAAHVETRAVLTPEQIAAYDRLRGYGGTEAHARAHH